MLIELPIDAQPYGWRLVSRPGADQRRASSTVRSDVNLLADIMGAQESLAPQLKVSVLGPMSLAASLHLHYGERALGDYGARREIAASLAAGLVEHLAALRQAVPGTELVLQFDEPEIVRVLNGAIPTSSGYQTLRSIPLEEVRAAWDLVVSAARSAGVTDVLFALPEVGSAMEAALTIGADGVGVALDSLATKDWDQLAMAAEAGKNLYLGIVNPLEAQSGPQSAPQREPQSAGRRTQGPAVSSLVDAVMRPWRGVGLSNATLGTLVVTPSSGLEKVSPQQATSVLRRLTDTARALNDVMSE